MKYFLQIYIDGYWDYIVLQNKYKIWYTKISNENYLLNYLYKQFKFALVETRNRNKYSGMMKIELSWSVS